MIIALFLLVLASLLIGVIGYLDLSARLEAIKRGLIRVENALASEEWMDTLQESGGVEPDAFEWIRRCGVSARLDRIEAAVDPMMRAKRDVKQVMDELEEALHEDPGNAYDHYQVSKIAELLEQGERPDREIWAQRIRTPFPWP